MFDNQTIAYITTLPEVETARLPKGALFLANGRIYQVTETGTGGYHKAREWRQTETTEVALVPGSIPSKHLPLVRRGKILPVYRSRLELTDTDTDQATCFVFPTEGLALDAAYLDVALIQSSGAYVRNQGHDPAFAVTDGVHIFRLYYYRQSAGGRRADLSSLRARPLSFRPKLHTDGPDYWRLLPSWTEIIPHADVTQQMRAIEPPFTGDETVPHMPIPPIDTE
ncbi:MAG: hypothetical protein JXQ72_01010 [Anaerolineae bacterium]|nr:hypothetical protein [Anaerolineae bacterium]